MWSFHRIHFRMNQFQWNASESGAVSYFTFYFSFHFVFFFRWNLSFRFDVGRRRWGDRMAGGGWRRRRRLRPRVVFFSFFFFFWDFSSNFRGLVQRNWRNETGRKSRRKRRSGLPVNKKKTNKNWKTKIEKKKFTQTIANKKNLRPSERGTREKPPTTAKTNEDPKTVR